MQLDVTLRQMQPADGQALAALFAHSPDGGRFAIAARYHIDPYLAMHALDPGVVGVVAERPSTGDLVGMALVRLGECCVDGEKRPYALLTSLMVHPDYRRQGIAAQLVQWRVAYARRRLGKETLLLAFIQEGNDASLAVAQKWAQQIGGELQSGLVRVRSKPPRSVAGVTVRAAQSADLASIAAGMNEFYRAYALYRPETAVTLSAWLQTSPFDTPIRRIFVAETKAGEIVAGLAVTEQCRLTTMEVQQMPGLVRLLNKVVRMVPPDGVLRQLGVSKVWYAPGRQDAAQYLWQSIRWQSRHQGSHLVCSYDPRGALPDVLRLPFWLPKGSSVLAATGPVPFKDDWLLYPL